MRYIAPQPNGCWRWTGYVHTYGYGRFREGTAGSRKVQAHRFGYEYFIGPIPKGLDLDHLCRNRACVNPDHLEPVTRRINLLRGIGLPAIEIRQTHCPKGHPYNGDNLLTYHGWRECKTCVYTRNREAKRRRRAALV